MVLGRGDDPVNTTRTSTTAAPVPVSPPAVEAVTTPPATPAAYRLTLTAAGAGPPVVIRLRRCLKAMKRSWGLACIRIEAVQPTPPTGVGAERRAPVAEVDPAVADSPDS
jgi:hypothetical protein